MEFKRQEHRTIAEALSLLDRDLFLDSQCWFAGGTAIVMLLGEYRLSLDVDFLCADADGYRRLRGAAVEKGLPAFFGPPVSPIREFRADQYGIRTVFGINGQQIRFEIVREARIHLAGALHAGLNVPVLAVEDMFTEKLLANADRCQDRAVAYRDAFDLGMLLGAYGAFPDASVVKAEQAYGADIGRKMLWVTGKLADAAELRRAAEVLQMDPELAIAAIDRLRAEAARLWQI
ncbi:nucleotidyl transferase AbiEii/AbiGii toxin family protein [Rhizobium sp. OAE497]|uniref:nucleotidyl transferase AbiEii/AbiGii toxin family protein n=1 Tax=Rhizobium sp. OAE497 TaxID=2663796 RepID=UPI0018F42621